MAATVVTIRDESKWEVISEFLSELEQAGIVISPAEAKQLDEEHGADWEESLSYWSIVTTVKRYTFLTKSEKEYK